MKFASYDIVFQEVPGEVTLAINLTNCPNSCKGCHSPHLQKDTGEILDENVIAQLLEKYGDAITCVCFMGGDDTPREVLQLAKFVKQLHKKTAWYSGMQTLPEGSYLQYLDYIKVGPYTEHLGGLNSASTNQKFYRVENNAMIDITGKFQ